MSIRLTGGRRGVVLCSAPTLPQTTLSQQIDSRGARFLSIRRRTKVSLVNS